MDRTTPADLRVYGVAALFLVDFSLLAAPPRRNQHDRVFPRCGAPHDTDTRQARRRACEEIRMIWLTQQTFDRLAAELEDRRGPVRAEIVERISSARDEGDLKENGGDHAAQDGQGTQQGPPPPPEGRRQDATTPPPPGDP